jgi:hypothetical protein
MADRDELADRVDDGLFGLEILENTARHVGVGARW